MLRRVSLEKVQVQLDREAAARENTEAGRNGDGPSPAPRPRRTLAPLVPPAIPDPLGHDCKPDPMAAHTEAEFVATMRRYRQWAGNPGLREMAQQVPGGPSFTTFRNMLASDKVPSKLKNVYAFVRALNGDERDMQRWARAWRRFRQEGADPDQGGRDTVQFILNAFHDSYESA